MAGQEAGELVQRCASGRDAEVWREFMERFGSRLVAGVRRGLRRSGFDGGRPEQVEDLLQEVYCRLLDKGRRNLRRCRGRREGAVAAYLARVAESVAIDHLRAEGAKKRGRARLVWPAGDSASALTERAVDPSLGPEDRLLRHERRWTFLARCREVVGPRAPARDLRILYLAYIQGMSSREIARAIGHGLTPSSIDSLVHRARKRLRARGLGVPNRRQRSCAVPR